ncbi:MAG: hypothetical protein R2857_11900 [Vampirovibrionales bacterium]
MPDIDTAAVRQIADSQTETEVREELNLPYLLDRNEAVPSTWPACSASGRSLRS